MFPYIYAERDGIHILDLVQTSQLLNEAALFVNTAAQKGKLSFCRNKTSSFSSNCARSSQL